VQEADMKIIFFSLQFDGGKHVHAQEMTFSGDQEI
jgi:hypothetical protein